MADRRHLTAERRRAHAAGQRRITYYCSCGKLVTGNVAWWSHRDANPQHATVSREAWAQLTADPPGQQRIGEPDG